MQAASQAQGAPVQQAFPVPESSPLPDEFAVLDGLERLMYSPPDGSDDRLPPPWFTAAQAERGIFTGPQRGRTIEEIMQLLRSARDDAVQPCPVHHMHMQLRWPDAHGLEGLDSAAPRRVMDALNITWLPLVRWPVSQHSHACSFQLHD